MKHKILDYVEDAVSQFLYYDRQEDEDLPLGAIEEAIKNGDITIEDITQQFAKELRDNLI